MTEKDGHENSEGSSLGQMSMSKPSFRPWTCIPPSPRSLRQHSHGMLTRVPGPPDSHGAEGEETGKACGEGEKSEIQNEVLGSRKIPEFIHVFMG